MRPDETEDTEDEGCDFVSNVDYDVVYIALGLFFTLGAVFGWGVTRLYFHI